MNEETARIIINFLEQLGVEVNNKVSALVEVSWPVIVRQVYVSALGFGIFFLALVSLSIISFYFYKKATEEKNEYVENGGSIFREQYEELQFVQFLTAIISVLTGAGSLFPLHAILVRLINPLWYAARLLQEVIK